MKRLLLFQIQDGLKFPYELIFGDADRPLLITTVNTNVRAVGAYVPSGEAPMVLNFKKLQDDGTSVPVVFRVEPNSWAILSIDATQPQVRIITKDDIPEGFAEAMPFFTERPCWFAGCAELRVQYQAAVSKLEEDGPCSDCDRGVIIREFLPQVVSLLKRDGKLPELS